MVIAFNTGFLTSEKKGLREFFLENCIREIIATKTEHDFVMIFDRPFDPGLYQFPNLTTVILKRNGNSPLSRKLWYDIRLPSVLKRFNADSLVSFDGICSMSVSIPQYMFLPADRLDGLPALVPGDNQWWRRYFFPRFLKKAQKIGVWSDRLQRELMDNCKLPPEKTQLIHYAPDPVFGPLPETSIQATKNSYTQGQEYYFSLADFGKTKELLVLLKAFSAFKKMLHSQWKLVIAFPSGEQPADFLKKLANYKYRQDVVVTQFANRHELAQLVGSAYCLVNCDTCPFPIPELEAMSSGVALVTGKDSGLREWADAAMFTDIGDHNTLAESMMRLYKDEGYRKELIHRGQERVRHYTIHRSAEECWSCIAGNS